MHYFVLQKSITWLSCMIWASSRTLPPERSRARGSTHTTTGDSSFHLRPTHSCSTGIISHTNDHFFLLQNMEENILRNDGSMLFKILSFVLVIQVWMSKWWQKYIIIIRSKSKIICNIIWQFSFQFYNRFYHQNLSSCVFLVMISTI